ncbi:hypothetical protein [Candidatus Pelagibacter communis]|uniref:hypothetical protein n=1 Tax=Pelagibacter ubique TaxID=198252 RepID=UPI000AA848FF|nr:hypothetical protein [Candidatus Pelagibacter ubique]
MRILLLIIFIILLSCSYNNTDDNSIKIDISDNLTFDEFKELIEKKGLEKDYPDINK